MDQQIRVNSWRLVLIGLAAGILGGGLGVGGGIVIVPLLLWAGLGRHRAHATSLAAIIFIASAGAFSFGISGEVDLVAGITVGMGGVVGSVVGATVMHRVSARALTMVFGLVLLVAGIRLVLSAEPLPGAADFPMLGQTAIALGIGIVSGFFAGLAGIGGGVVIVPSTVFLLGLEQHEAQGTSLLAIVLTSVAGSLVNRRNQRLRLMDGLVTGVGGIVGSLIGSRLALLLEARTLSVLFGVLVLFVALRTLYRSLRESPRMERLNP